MQDRCETLFPRLGSQIGYRLLARPRARLSLEKTVIGCRKMLRKLEHFFVVGCVAFIGADRIDLFAGHGFFKLTPFLFFAPLVVLSRLLFMGWGKGFQVAVIPPLRRQVPYLFVFALFLLVSFTSTIFGLNPDRGIISLFDLVLVSALGYCISARILADPAPEKLVARCVTLALVVWLFFCVATSIAWSQGFFRCRTSPLRPSDLFLRLPQLYLAWGLACPALVSIQIARASSW